METIQKVKMIIANHVVQFNANEELDLDLELVSCGVNSMNLIRMIVDIEDEFNFEFDDSDLDINKLRTFRLLLEYIEANRDANSYV